MASSTLLFEKSSFRRTDAETDTVGGATIEPLTGDDKGPRDGFLLAGDCKNVLIGDLERGGGTRIPPRFRSVRAAVGSGMVPAPKSIPPSLHDTRAYFGRHILSPTSMSSSLDMVAFAFFRTPLAF
jgi:hypothetical protein